MPRFTAVLDDALAANTQHAVLAFQYQPLDEEKAALNLALRRPNLSVYARDGAVIFGVPGIWQPGKPPTEDWESVRSTFWSSTAADIGGEFLLGDFAMLARFCALAHAVTFKLEAETAGAMPVDEEGEAQPTAGENPFAGDVDA